MKFTDLSQEQQRFIQCALSGQNILVDACIGSGKTTAIQALCDMMPGKRILYLTYNKLLKLDAKSRIQNSNTYVTNYHGFCYMELRSIGVSCGISDIIQTYNKKKPKPAVYDVLILDEYQDIEQEIGDMLWHLKDCNPNMQLIAVGDMAQKIYDKTRLDVQSFIVDFLDVFSCMEFTQCFRIGAKHAAMLSRVWGKQIVGVNPDFTVDTMTESETLYFLSDLSPHQILVLGSNDGQRGVLQNWLEKNCPDRFNKQTVWSKISEREGSTLPTPDCAIFTTFDGCKGMEREVCVICDWSLPYWNARLKKPNARYEIIRNIFCVAASRGKRKIIFLQSKQPLTEELLLEQPSNTETFTDMAVSEMFDFKFAEDVEAAYDCLSVTEIQPVGEEIDVPTSDELIDLSFCLGHYQEVLHFQNYNINKDIEFQLARADKSHLRMKYQKWTLDEKILYLAMLETGQYRYWSQVSWPIVSVNEREQIDARLFTHLGIDETVQIPCSLLVQSGSQSFGIDGILDVEKDNVIYELKFVRELSHVHCLQLAMYLVCRYIKVGYLWNTRTNQMLRIEVPDRQAFLDKMIYAVTKGSIQRFRESEVILCENFLGIHTKETRLLWKEAKKKKRCSGKWAEMFLSDLGLSLPVSGIRFLKYLKSQKAV